MRLDRNHRDKEVPETKEDYFEWLLNVERLQSRSKSSIFFSLGKRFVTSTWWREFLTTSAINEARSIFRNLSTDLYLSSRTRPRILYRYRPLGTQGHESIDCERIEQITVKNELWFSSIDSLNDPNEFQSDQGWQINWHSPSLRDALAVTSSHLQQSFLRETGICCFSESPTNMALWSYYANSHKGICFGFSTESQWFNGVFPVRYVNVDPRLRPKHHLHPDQFLKRSCVHKHTDWTHESEWRMIKHGQKNGVLYPSECLKEVIFGIRISPDDFLAVQDILKGMLPKVKQYVAVPSPSGIKLVLLEEGPVSVTRQLAGIASTNQPRSSDKWRPHLIPRDQNTTNRNNTNR